jgi:hypothetical protein
VNIANAAVFGMSQELGLVGNEYNIALVILSVRSLRHALSCAHVSTSFVPYVILEIPGNVFLKKFKPHVWRKLRLAAGRTSASALTYRSGVVSGCMFLFGAISVAQGTVRNYSGLLATRFFLGLTECNAFPGCFYLIAM